MKVYAKHPVKYNGEWYFAGDEIDMSIPDMKAYEQFVEADEYAEEGAEERLEFPEEPVKRPRGRPRKI